MSPGVVGLSTLAYTLLLPALVEWFGPEAFRYCLVPVVLGGLLFGKRGLLVLVVIILVHTVFQSLAQHRYPFLTSRFAVHGVVFSTGIGLVGAVMGEMQLRIRRLNQQLREMSLVDPLTGLHNRRFASEVISNVAQNFAIKKTHPEVKQRRSYLETRVMGIFLVDIDHFKCINDEFGHTTGDKVLVRVAKALESCIRFDDVIVRWGGEEFLVVLADTDPDYLSRFATKLLHAVQASTVEPSPGKAVTVTISAGYLPFPLFGSEGGPTFEESVNLADYALYQAKADGRNRAVCFAAPETLSYEELLGAARRRWPEARPSLRQPRASRWPPKAGRSGAPAARGDLAGARPGP